MLLLRQKKKKWPLIFGGIIEVGREFGIGRFLANIKIQWPLIFIEIGRISIYWIRKLELGVTQAWT
jgi:hypothetical protein